MKLSCLCSSTICTDVQFYTIRYFCLESNENDTTRSQSISRGGDKKFPPPPRSLYFYNPRRVYSSRRLSRWALRTKIHKSRAGRVPPLKTRRYDRRDRWVEEA